MHKAAWRLDQGRPDSKLTAIAKLYACHVAVEVVDEALQIHGGYGYFNDNDIERFYRAAKVLREFMREPKRLKKSSLPETPLANSNEQVLDFREVTGMVGREWWLPREMMGLGSVLLFSSSL